MRYYKQAIMVAAAVFALSACGSQPKAEKKAENAASAVSESAESKAESSAASESAESKAESSAASESASAQTSESKDEAKASESLASSIPQEKGTPIDAKDLKPGIYAATSDAKGLPVQVAIHPYHGFSILRGKDNPFIPQGTYELLDDNLIFLSDGQLNFLFKVVSDKQLVYLGISKASKSKPLDKGVVYQLLDEKAAAQSPLKCDENPEMVFVQGSLYVVTAKIGDVAKDAKVEPLTDVVDKTTLPSKDGQTNFKTDGYVLGEKGQLLVKVDNDWHVFSKVEPAK